MEKPECFLCAHPGNYLPTAINWLISEKKMCEFHKTKAEVLIEKKNQPLAYKDDREPNDGSLME